MDTNLIFLISLPRSGSTMLQRILGGHPSIHTLPEPWVMLHPLYALKRSGIETEYESHFARLALDEFLNRVEGGEETYLEGIRAMASVLYGACLKPSGKPLFLDKTPRYYYIIPELFKTFPKARFIFLLRNPLAILSSMLETWFQNSVPLLKDSQNYQDLLKGPRYLAEGIAALGKDAIVLHYEQLAQYPGREIEKLCTRLDLTYSPQLLEYGKRKFARSAFGDPAGVARFERPVTDSIEKWKRNLTQSSLMDFAYEYLEEADKRNIAALGYDLGRLKEELGNPGLPLPDSPGRVATLTTAAPADKQAEKIPKTRVASKCAHTFPLPRISIVTPSYNQGQYLEECIDSILGQGYPRLEYIIMDGGSTDHSLEIIKKYEKHITFWQSQPDDGHYAAINTAFSRATGEIMYWLNSDDKLHPGALWLVAKVFSCYPEIEWIMGRPSVWNQNGRLAGVLSPLPAWSREKYLQGEIGPPHIQQESTFWRRSLWERAGGRLDSRYALAGDLELWARFFRYAQLYVVDALLGGFRSYGSQRSKAHADQYAKEARAVIARENDLYLNQKQPSLLTAPPSVDMGSLAARDPDFFKLENFNYFSYSKKSHFAVFGDADLQVYGGRIDPETADLKAYQDLFMYAFITRNVPAGARILEIGGGDSRVLRALKNRYECWNIDKLEGLGNGPTHADRAGIMLVRAYMGDFSPELPDGYFDLVFSISALEHVEENETIFTAICRDIDRVLKTGGISLHTVDLVWKQTEVWSKDIVPFIFQNIRTCNAAVPFEDMVRDPALYCMSEAAYERLWRPIVKQSYTDFGRPLACNVAWIKAGDGSHLASPLCRTGDHAASQAEALVEIEEKITSGDQEIFSAIQEKYAGSPSCLNLIGDSLYKSGRKGEAKLFFESMIASRPDFVPFYGSLAVILWEEGDNLSALQLLKGGLARDPSSRKLIINAGRILAAMGHPQDAGKVYGNYLVKHPGDQEIETLLTEIPTGKGHLASQPKALGVSRQDAEIIEARRKQKNTKKPPRISALVSTYSSEDFVAECLEDLLGQTIAEQIEIVVIDAASPQDERRVVLAYQDRFPNITYLRTRGRIGVYAAWNIAIREAEGEYLISCSTNDRLHQAACENLMRILDQNPGVALAYGDSLLTHVPHETFHKNSAYCAYRWPAYSFDTLLHTCLVGPHPLWRRDLHEELGYFDERYVAIGDQDFWLRIGEKFPLVHLAEYTTLHWISETSLSQDQDTAPREIREIHTRYQLRNLDRLMATQAIEKASRQLDLHRTKYELLSLERYPAWITRHAFREIEPVLWQRESQTWTQFPKIAIYLKLDSENPELLADTIDSFAAQLYPNWKLVVIAPFAAFSPAFSDHDELEWIETREDFWHVINDHSSRSEIDWLGHIQAGDALAPQCLVSFAQGINQDHNLQLIYCDHDILQDGRRKYPCFKPDFNLDMLRSTNYIGHAYLIRRDLFTQIGGYNRTFRFAEDYDLILKALDACSENATAHIADVLYHLKPVSLDHEEEELRTVASKITLTRHLQRNSIRGEVIEGNLPDTFRVLYYHEEHPLVSVIIPTKDQSQFIKPCITSLMEETSYQHFEVIIADNATSEPEAREFLSSLSQLYGDKIKVIPFEKPFNYSAVNNEAARLAKGDYLLFLNNDTEVVQNNWLDVMLAYGQRKDVGIVGARLLYPNKTIQHAGVIVGMEGVADHPFLGEAVEEPGYMNRLQIDQNYSAVTAAALLIRRAVFDQIQGFNETEFSINFSDVDLCLKARQIGYKILWTPFVSLIHHGSVTQQQLDKEQAAQKRKVFLKDRSSFVRKWLPILPSDSAYNRNLSLAKQDNFTINIVEEPSWNPVLTKTARIWAVPRANDGGGHYRVIAPVSALHESGLALGHAANRHIEHWQLLQHAPDSILLQTPVSDYDLNYLELLRKVYQGMIIYEIDDLLTRIPRKNPACKNIPADIRNRIRTALKSCDRMVVSTEPLAEAFKDYCQDIRVVPNYLARSVWGGIKSQRRAGKKPRVGWAGGSYHYGDLMIIKEVVQELAGEVEWVFMGMCPDEIKPHVHEFYPGVEIKEYPEKLAALNLDLALAPLEENPFNEGKSHLRVLEYGILGWPVVATNIYPYQKAPVSLVKNRFKDWLKAIRSMINDLDALASEGDQLRTWVLENWILEDHLEEILPAYVATAANVAGPRSKLDARVQN